MPQLDIANFMPQILWFVPIYSILYLDFYRSFFKPVSFMYRTELNCLFFGNHKVALNRIKFHTLSYLKDYSIIKNISYGTHYNNLSITLAGIAYYTNFKQKINE